VIVLARDGVSPVPPESDDENKKKDEDKKDADKKDDKTDAGQDKDAAKGDEKKDDSKKKEEEKPKPTVIDLAGIGNRILSLPIPSRNYIGLSVGKTGVLFLAEGDPVGRASSDDGPPIRSLWRFTTEKRQTEEILSGLTGYDVSFNGEKLFYMRAKTAGFSLPLRISSPVPRTPRKANP
jgi:tricorn protease